MASRISGALAGVLLAAFGFFATAPLTQLKANPVEAARMNNLGAAYMNQQLFEKGLKSFRQAAELDPKLTMARLNEGIALLNLQKIDEAKAALEDSIKQDSKIPNAWYNLGLLAKNTGDAQAAIDAFKHVIEIDANDADTWYFLGSVYVQAKQFPQAIEAFQHALQLNPLHASAEFGLSRAYQQSSNLDHAREHLKKFQYITQNKLGAPVSLAYGEQGQYSRAVEAASAVLKAPAQIKVRFVDVTKEAGLVFNPARTSVAAYNGFPYSLGSGACFLDYDNDGRIDLFVADEGAHGGVSLFRNLGNGKFEDVSKNLGTDQYAHGTGCAVGDYDNEGFEDIAFTSNWGVGLLHNEKNGTFNDLLTGSGIGGGASGRTGKGADSQAQPPEVSIPPTRADLNTIFPPTITPIGVTFVDFDHDGDLDLYIAQSNQVPWPSKEATPPPAPSLLWRNNGNGRFSDVTSTTGPFGDPETIAAIGTDFNNDRAVDLVVTGRDPTIFENQREGRFLPRKLWSQPMPAQTLGVAVLDFDHDGWMDLAFTHLG